MSCHEVAPLSPTQERVTSPTSLVDGRESCPSIVRNQKSENHRVTGSTLRGLLEIFRVSGPEWGRKTEGSTPHPVRDPTRSEKT